MQPCYVYLPRSVLLIADEPTQTAAITTERQELIIITMVEQIHIVMMMTTMTIIVNSIAIQNPIPVRLKHPQKAVAPGQAQR